MKLNGIMVIATMALLLAGPAMANDDASFIPYDWWASRDDRNGPSAPGSAGGKIANVSRTSYSPPACAAPQCVRPSIQAVSIAKDVRAVTTAAQASLRDKAQAQARREYEALLAKGVRPQYKVNGQTWVEARTKELMQGATTTARTNAIQCKNDQPAVTGMAAAAAVTGPVNFEIPKRVGREAAQSVTAKAQAELERLSAASRQGEAVKSNGPVYALRPNPVLAELGMRPSESLIQPQRTVGGSGPACSLRTNPIFEQLGMTARPNNSRP